MKVSLATFRGEAPRIKPRALPNEMSQQAKMCRMLSGDLEAWHDIEKVHVLGKSGPINTIRLFAGKYWLSWAESEVATGFADIDVARIPVAGNTNYLTIITGTGEPQLLTLSSATGGSNDPYGAYPLSTSSLAVNAPTTAPTISSNVPAAAQDSTTYTYDCSSFADWTPQEQHDGSWNTDWSIDATVGNPASSWLAHVNHFAYTTCVSQKDYQISTCQQFTLSWDGSVSGDGVSNEFAFAGVYEGPNTLDNLPRVGLNPAAGTFYITPTNSFAGATATGLTLAYDTLYRVTVTAVAGNNDNGDKGFSVTASLTCNQGAVSQTLGPVFVPYLGSSFAAVTVDTRNDETYRDIHWDNVNIVVQQPATQITPVYSSYVYTEVNGSGFESAPSPASDTVQVDNGITNTLTLPAATSGTAKMYVYRAATGSAGTQFLFDGEIDSPSTSASNTFTDSKTTADLGDPLKTTNYDPPPSDMRGAVALPNQVIAAFSGTTLLLSEQGYAYAFPQEYRKATDSNIVGIGAIDSTVLILTEQHPYTAYGDTPDAYVMTKEEFIQGCVSKRSIAFLRGEGILYASTDGIYAYAGQGNIRRLTDGLFTRREWVELNPSSIHGIVHQNLYFFWYEKTDGTKGGYILDPDPNGFGLTEMDFHALCAFNDPETDTLYMVLDNQTQIPGYLVADNDLVAFDSHTSLRPYTWRSKRFQFQYPTAFQMARVRAENYDPTLAVTLYADGATDPYATLSPTDNGEFVIPPAVMREFEFQITGVSDIQTVEFVERVEDLQ